MLKLTATQDCPLAIGPTTDKKGNPAPIDDTVPPEWFSSNTDIVTVTPDPNDGKKATISAVGPLGTAQVNVRVDVDTSEGTKPGIGVLDVEVVAGEAALITIEPGTPVEQP